MSDLTQGIAVTPKPPYYAAILTVVPGEDATGYAAMATRMIEMAKSQEGFLGVESAEADLGIIVSYWESMASIESWGRNAFHQSAKTLGKATWYQAFRTRICKVEHEY